MFFHINPIMFLTAKIIQSTDLPSFAERGTIIERLSDAILIHLPHRSSAHGALLN